MKHLYVAFTMLFIFGFLHADPVSEKEAKQVALSYYSHIVSSTVTDLSVEKVTIKRKEGLITFYIVHFLPSGFVIVAADDASIPILGYSADNSFPEEISCPAVNDWLDDYSRQIAYIVKSKKSNKKTRMQWDDIQHEVFPESMRDVGPLLTTTWWQGCYYNELCPEDPSATSFCGHVPTGCVATAMAQIMKYHEYPPQGVGSYSYTHPVYGMQSVDFGNTAYDWASMPPYLTNNNLAVATIMYHAGVSVNMNYSVNPGSAAYGVDVIESFVDYFNYMPGLEWHAHKDYLELDDWKDLLRDDLDNNWPILYAGIDPAEGHVFVCDGYRMIDEKFHFNWGWGSNFDGFYTIGALNPGNYNFSQDNFALVHIRPDNPDLITRIVSPYDNYVSEVNEPVMIEVSTVRGMPDNMFITIDGTTVATGSLTTLEYIWNTTPADLGAHDVTSWSVTGEDTVFYPITLNISKWSTQASRFQTTLRAISSISAIDSSAAWAIAWNGIWINNMFIPCQDFTRTVDGGTTWTAGTIPNTEGLTSSMILALNADIAYVLMYKLSGNNLPGVYVTTNGGVTWNRQATALFNSPYSWPNCIHFFNENEGWCMGDPTPQTGGFEMYTTTDGGANWVQVISGNIPAPLSNEYGMTEGYSAVDDIIWFGTTRGRIYKSTDKGNTWTVTAVQGMESEWIIPVFKNDLQGLVHNFFNWPDDGKIHETLDGGETWFLVNHIGPMYFTDLTFVPGTENTWVSTGGRRVQLDNLKGASISHDGGHTWMVFPGTEGVSFRQMAWVSQTCGWAGGHNISETQGGIFKFGGDSINTFIPDQYQERDISIIAYPNPFSSYITLEYELIKPGNVKITIFNQLGQQIETIDLVDYQSGKQQYVWDTSGILNGIYFIHVRIGQKMSTRKIVKII